MPIAPKFAIICYDGQVYILTLPCISLEDYPHRGVQVAYVYYEEEAGRRSAAKMGGSRPTWRSCRSCCTMTEATRAIVSAVRVTVGILPVTGPDALQPGAISFGRLPRS
jgi:hypothetical protein